MENEIINEMSDSEVFGVFYRFGGILVGETIEMTPLEKLLRSDEEIDKSIYARLEKLNK